MTNNRHGKRLLSLTLVLTLMLSLAPVAFAADEDEVPWAKDAVDALNGSYDYGAFKANDAVVTRVAAKELFIDIGFLNVEDADEIFGAAPEGDLTRAELCAVVSKTLRLEFEKDPTEYFEDCEDLEEQEVIGVATLASLGVISGREPGKFAPEGSVINAELAVIFYRALNAAAGGTAGWFEHLKPGQYGYFEALYLMVRVEGGSFDRGSLDKDTVFDNEPGDESDNDFSITITVYPEDPSEPPIQETFTKKSDIIGYWQRRLEGAWPEDVDVDFDVDIDWPDLDGEDNVLDAIVALVSEYRTVLLDRAPDKAGIFSDVAEGTPYYDGVMYLCNNGIVIGKGGGRFDPDNEGLNGELAALMARIRGALELNGAESDIVDEYEALQSGEGSWNTYFSGFANFDAFKIKFTETFTHTNFTFMKDGVKQLHWSAPYFWVFRENYFDGEESTTGIDPQQLATREQMAYAAYALYKEYKSAANLDGTVNTAVLDRFNDKEDISREEYRTAMAYLVSIGAMSGTQAGKLLPQESIARWQLGVFFSRILRGLDSSKMYDYETAVSNVLEVK